MSDYDAGSGTEDYLRRRKLNVTDAPSVRMQIDRLGRVWQYGDTAAQASPDRLARKLSDSLPDLSGSWHMLVL